VPQEKMADTNIGALCQSAEGSVIFINQCMVQRLESGVYFVPTITLFQMT